MRRLRRSSVVFWISAAALAAVTGIAVSGFVADAEARAARFGAVRTVWVATRPVAAGAVLRSGDLDRREMPAAFVPADPVTWSPAGRTVVMAISPGEVILAAKVAPSGLRGAAALLSQGERAVAVPTSASTPPLGVGDLVDVVATSPDGSATEVAARRARVLAVDDRAVTVAVRTVDAVAVASALAVATVTLALAAP